MTSLWFRHLRADDRVSVKPHASPVLHAINYLLGELDESTRPCCGRSAACRATRAGSRTPIRSTTRPVSVGIGATAPIWGAVARRYLNGRFISPAAAGRQELPRGRRRQDNPAAAGRQDNPAAAGRQDSTAAPARQYSLLGDAELDEGAVWEAVVDPGVAELGEIVWVVDVNRQSLDRVVPLITAACCAACSARPAAGHHAEVRALLEELFAGPAGRRCGTGSTPCPIPSTSGCSAAIRTSSGSACPAGTRPWPSSWPTWTTRPWPARSATSAATTWRRWTRPTGPSMTAGPRSSWPTRSRATAWPSRGTRRTTRRC